MLVRLLFENPLVFFLVLAALVISLCIHEFAHALMADKLGDNTPRLFGRVSLDPRVHLDPIGSLLLIFAGFGWGKPVPFNPLNLKNPKRDSALIALAGPSSNLLLACVLAVFYHLLSVGGIWGYFLSLTIFYNLVLGVFNLIPFHPLDGFKVVAGFLPVSLYFQWMQLQPYGIYLLLFLIFTNATNVVINPIINLLLNLLRL